MFELSRIGEAIRAEGGVWRRLFLAYSAALSAVPLLGRTAKAEASPSFALDPFTPGFASRDPDAHSVVLWTRLAPTPLEPGGGIPSHAVKVTWEIAADETVKSIVAKGKTVATPQLGHSVHVEVSGLKPDRWYWYRFRSDDAESPIGRTRTLPDPTVMPKQFRFAFASCQNYEQGLYTAYECPTTWLSATS